MVPVGLTRDDVLTYRRRVQGLEERRPYGPDALRGAAWAGLTDSMPRAAVLSVHARLSDASPQAWQDPSLVQLWGPRFSAYAVAAQDHAVFSLGRLPTDEGRRRHAEDLAERLHAVLDGREMPYGEAGRAVGEHRNQLRYAAPTGRVLIRWDGARQPTVRTVPRPDMDSAEARRELVRRYVHVLGPVTAERFAAWAGLRPRGAVAAFEAARPKLVQVCTDLGDAWVLAQDEATFREPTDSPAPARLLPRGDTFFLLHGADRELLVRDPQHRAALWTSRVWPGAVLVDGDVVGTWRRAEETVNRHPVAHAPCRRAGGGGARGVIDAPA